MSTTELQPKGENIRKAVKWISEVCKEYPKKGRKKIILEAELRFDLSPMECEFLYKNFT